MRELAEALRDAIRAYRIADDRGDEVTRGAAYARMEAIHAEIQLASRRGRR